MANDVHLRFQILAWMKALLLLARLSGSGMTVDTPDVPNLNPAPDIGIFQESAAARHPSFLLKQIDEWKIVLLIPVLVIHPIGLHVVRAGQQGHPAPHPDGI